MREILFRGKLLRDGRWAEGNLDIKKSGVCIITPDETPLGSYGQVDPETVGQYTGLTANGKRIFEGDIIHARYAEDGSLTGGFVNFTNGCFCVCYFGNNPAIDLLKEYKIIGNIHDNPELIGGKKDV